MFLHSKGKQQQNQETTQRMGEHIRWYIWWGINIQNLQGTYKTQHLRNQNNPIKQ